MSHAPQSRDDVDPIEAEIRRIDPKLSIVWDPKAIAKSEGFDVWGIAKWSYQGRWKVLREVEDGRMEEVYMLRFDGEGKDAYREVGEWLVVFFRKWDAAQSHFRKEWEKAWAEHERAEAAQSHLDDAQGIQVLDEMAFNLNGPFLIGRGI